MNWDSYLEPVTSVLEVTETLATRDIDGKWTYTSILMDKTFMNSEPEGEKSQTPVLRSLIDVPSSD